MPQKIVFAQVLQQLMDERYRRNRSALAEAAHISPSALSQYVRGRATPSLEVLVHLAEILDVSLEYLIFGRERLTPSAELGYLPYLEAHIRGVAAQSASLHDLVARIGAKVGETIYATARDILPETSNLGGMLDSTDVINIERCDSHTAIVTRDLNLNVEARADVSAPNVFQQVVAENIRDGGHYMYVIPEGAGWRQAATLLQQEMQRITELSSSQLNQQLHVRYVAEACVPGSIVHHFDREALNRQATELAARVERFTWNDPEDDKMGFIAHTECTNRHFDLIPRENIPRILSDLSTFWKANEESSVNPYQAFHGSSDVSVFEQLGLSPRTNPRSHEV